MKRYFFDFNKVKVLVEAKGISHRKIAIESGLSDHGIARMIRGQHYPTAKNLCKISSVLGVKPGFFFTEEVKTMGPTHMLIIIRGNKPYKVYYCTGPKCLLKADPGSVCHSEQEALGLGWKRVGKEWRCPYE